jgi:putative intracellular protease/amidase
MSKRALVIIAPGCEEIEAVTSIDTLVRGNIKVTVASINPKNCCESQGFRGAGSEPAGKPVRRQAGRVVWLAEVS